MVVDVNIIDGTIICSVVTCVKTSHTDLNWKSVKIFVEFFQKFIRKINA